MNTENEGQGTLGKQQFNVYLPLGLVRQIKHAAIDEDYSVSRFVEHVFREYLARTRGEKTDER